MRRERETRRKEQQERDQEEKRKIGKRRKTEHKKKETGAKNPIHWVTFFVGQLVWKTTLPSRIDSSAIVTGQI